MAERTASRRTAAAPAAPQRRPDDHHGAKLPVESATAPTAGTHLADARATRSATPATPATPASPARPATSTREPVARARPAAMSAQDVPAVERARIDLRVQRCKKLAGRDKVVACRRRACEQHWGLVMACPFKLMPVRG